MRFNIYATITISSGTIIALIILGIVVAILAILAILYGIIVLRRIGIASKKIDYFFEDLSYKSEMLNSTVDTVSRFSNYVDIIDAFTKRNVKSWVKVATRNKDIVYKLIDKLKEFANSED
jgi:hypothetical protein